jgi:hypothetical protein
MPLPVQLPHLGYIAFNAGEAPFDDPDVRRAAALAMNRQALAAIWRQLPTPQLLRRLSLDSRTVTFPSGRAGSQAGAGAHER